MATLISILNHVDKKNFESPPVFSDEERVAFFDLPQWAFGVLQTLRKPVNRVGFLLQLGYFMSANKFYAARKYHHEDIEFVAEVLGIDLDEIDMSRYGGTTFERHQKIIIRNLGFQEFDRRAKKMLRKEAASLSRKQVRPRSIFMSLVDFLRSKKIEVPSYHALSEIIARALKALEQEMIAQLKQHVKADQKKLLNDLLDVDEEYLSEEKMDLKIKRYKITLLKKNSQSTKPSKIRGNVGDLACLKELFDELRPAMASLKMAPEIVQFYARIALKSQVFQLARRDERRYLYLLAFVIHQYHGLNDLLIDAALQSVQTARNSVFRIHKERTFEKRRSAQAAIDELVKKFDDHLEKMKEVERIVNADGMDDSEKIEAIRVVLSNRGDLEQMEKQIEALKQESAKVVNDEDYYDILSAKSVWLQNRVSPILKSIDFDVESSDPNIISAIEYFKRKDGNISASMPLDFLDEVQRKAVFDSAGKLRVSLCKILLFEKVADAIKSGALNLKYSYKYKPFETYLIPRNRWENEKEELLERAGLRGFENFDTIEPALREAIEDQFRVTNENIQAGKNKHAKFDNKGNLVLSTPRKEKMVLDPVAELFPKDRIIPIFEVLATINKLTQFTECFEHHHVKSIRKRPSPNVFIAGVTGLGCNHGIRRIAKISRNIGQNELEYAVNWHFTADNLIRCNDRVLELIERLQLPKIFKRDRKTTHTSSDGQKFNIHVESLNSAYSYKYFGKGKGVTVYVFLDESHRLFYSVVISSSESEAAYVIDGLMHNEIVQSDVHSTDTAGYSEVVFGVCHLLGISFAPRIKNFRDQYLYSFEKPSNLKALGYQILPSERINTKIIRENWDEILRFITTIKLRETTASQLFRRLSSYSRQHPLYRALKEFGKIIKTLFLLKYIDDIDLRQAIEKQLNKQENSNKFGKAVFHAKNQEFRQGTKEEQMITEGCKRLIENSVICWNYLYLSQLIHDATTEEEKERIVETVQNGSVVLWNHVNMQGEYDFSNEYLEGAIEFGINDILQLQVV